MHYKKAPILEAALEFRWSLEIPLDELRGALSLAEFGDFESPKPRLLLSAAFNVEAGEVSQESRQVGFDVARRDGSERVFLEQDKFVFIQLAPYSRWEHFFNRALEVMKPTINKLGVDTFSRVGVRFVNRIDAPCSDLGRINTDDYITIKVDGPRKDTGNIDEFQMRIVKPTSIEGIAYALVVATSQSPLPDHVGIVLDIDVFTRHPISVSGEGFLKTLADMRSEKNDIFQSCITDQSRALFGGVEA